MAEITLLHQEILMLKLRIVALESQKKSLESDLAVALAERDQADEANQVLSEKLKNTEKAYMVSQSLSAKKIEQLESALEDQFTDTDSD